MSQQSHTPSEINVKTKTFKHMSDILDNKRIYPVFQPIIDLKSGHVFGYEALSRIEDHSVIQSPEDLFTTAQRHDQTARLEEICREKALRKANELNLTGYLALNVCPSVLKATNHTRGVTAALIRDLDKVKSNIILELTERYYINDYALFIQTVDYYRAQGFRIAIDDLGAGFSDLKMLAQIEPYMVKIDGFMISNIHRSIKKQRLLKALVTFCHDVNALVSAECVEKPEELEVIIDMNVDLAQGFFLGRPEQTLSDCDPKAYEMIETRNQKRSSPNNSLSNTSIGALSAYVEPIQLSETVSDVSERFKKNQTLTTIPVLNENKPMGIVNKRELFYRLGQKFGYDLFARKYIRTFTEPALIFEDNIPLEEVAQRVLNRDERTIYDAVIVTKNGVYVGIVKIHHILERITEQKIKLAQQANPLTGLPGNMLIKDNIENRLNKNQVFAIMYFDLDHFKPFNDNFGFEQGDCVLQFLGTLLKKVIIEWDPRSFVGHVGGDDFIAVTRAQGIEALCQTIVKEFDEGVQSFHSEEICALGCYESKDRQGNVRTFNILSLSIAVVSTRERIFNSYGHVASVASEIKKKAKKLKGSSYYIDHRKD